MMLTEAVAKQCLNQLRGLVLSVVLWLVRKAYMKHVEKFRFS